ncbi:MAG: hypothetical protein JNM94_08465 [Phycisphaerae bacterium]|nr:hypothetical protein [Phycisphaerae bacterium]
MMVVGAAGDEYALTFTSKDPAMNTRRVHNRLKTASICLLMCAAGCATGRVRVQVTNAETGAPIEAGTVVRVSEAVMLFKGPDRMGTVENDGVVSILLSGGVWNVEFYRDAAAMKAGQRLGTVGVGVPNGRPAIERDFEQDMPGAGERWRVSVRNVGPA